MAQPLRKIFQKNLLSGAETATPGGRREGPVREAPAERRKGPARRRTLDLSGAATAALGLALACAVGWAFFMGYLVGRGEHPRRGVESVAGILLPKGTDGAVAERPPLPGAEALPPGEMSPASAQTPTATPGLQGGETPGAPQADTFAAVPTQAPQAPAYPFSRPQGEAVAAWGRTPEPEGATAKAAQGAPGKGAPVKAATVKSGQEKVATSPAPSPTKKPSPREPEKPAEPRFDYLFQAAAFRGPVDAERLRARLESAGLTARVRPSGKVRLVVVSLRGTAQEAREVRVRLAGMGLGRPILLEKKPVPEKAAGKKRPRSASQ